jgi:hypothetical protein
MTTGIYWSVLAPLALASAYVSAFSLPARVSLAVVAALAAALVAHHRARGGASAQRGMVCCLTILAAVYMAARPGGWFTQGAPAPLAAGVRSVYDFNTYYLAGQRVREAQSPYDTDYWSREGIVYFWYPPPVAEVLALLGSGGEQRAFDLTWVITFLTYLAAANLLCLLLVSYGCAPFAATVLTVGICGLNFPLLYWAAGSTQASLTMLALLLTSWLLSVRSPAGSAAALAGAVLLKVSPAFLLAVWVGLRQWRHVVWALVFLGVLVGLSMFPHGGVELWREFADAFPRLAPQYSSEMGLDGFLAAFVPGLRAPVAVGLKLLLLAWGFTIWRRTSLWQGGGRARTLADAWPVAQVLMMVLSPTIWPHHLIFALPSLVLLLHNVRTRRQLVWWLVGYAFMYIIPTNPRFPVSVLYLLTPMLMLHAFSAANPGGGPSVLERLQRGLEAGRAASLESSVAEQAPA